MAYIGVQPTAGQYRKLDNISASFNGSTTSFTISVGGTNVTAGTAQQLIVSLGGVIQQPDTDYTVSTNTITFTTAPTSGLDFFAILMGDALNTVTPSDGSVTTAKLAGSLSVGLAAGSVSAPSLFFTGDTNNGIFSPSTDAIAVTTTGSERLRVTSAGNVGIGVTTVGAKLHVSSGASGASISANADDLFVENNGNTGITIGSPNTALGSIRFTDPESNGAGSISYNHSDNSLAFTVNDSERFRCDSSGRLLVGTSSGSDNNALLKVQGNVGGITGTGWIDIRRGLTTPASGSQLGLLSFSDASGNHYAFIEGFTDAATGTNDYPGRIVLSTTADGASSPTERMRIDNKGSVSIGGNAGTNDWRFFVVSQTANSSSYAAIIRNSASTDLLNIRSDGVFYTGTAASSPYNLTTASAANVHCDSNGILYRSTSSARYKTEIENLDDQYADAILNCRPVWYRSTAPGDTAHSNWGYWGFIAEEVAEVDPRLVFWKTHETVCDEDGTETSVELKKPLAEGVQYDRFVPHLLNLIKRQQQAIEDLQAEVAALKAQ